MIDRTTYWLRVQRLTLFLFIFFLMTTILILFFSRELSQLTLLGWPLSFYMAAQGLTLIYVGLVAFYVWYMRNLEKSQKGQDSDG